MYGNELNPMILLKRTLLRIYKLLVKNFFFFTIKKKNNNNVQKSKKKKIGSSPTFLTLLHLLARLE